MKEEKGHFHLGKSGEPSQRYMTQAQLGEYESMDKWGKERIFHKTILHKINKVNMHVSFSIS